MPEADTDTTYFTFLRTCASWEEFARAKKDVQETGLTLQAARDACKEYNDNLSAAERERGLRMEFQRED